MILADKIINERKKNGWSQEELAEQLSVSRQSVSKWEGAQAVPDLQKIILMAEIFGVTTDYLLKDEMEPETTAPATIATMVEKPSVSENVRRVSLEEASEYLDTTRKNAPKIANGVSLCILSPIILIFLAGLSSDTRFGVSETVAAAVGMLSLLVIIAIAVYIFIIYNGKTSKYEFLERERIETAYGVKGLAEERKKAIEGKRTSFTALGVILCIFSPIPLVVAACLELPDYIIVTMVCVLLIIISVAVNLFERVGIEWNCCEKLLEEGDYSSENKATNRKMEKIGGIYWAVVCAGYLGWSFVTMRWDFTWIVWPVAGVLYGAVVCIVRAIDKN